MISMTELHFAVLNAMMDDYEDVEQVHLMVSRPGSFFVMLSTPLEFRCERE